MKFYPKQSKCPCCKTVYRYQDLKRLTWEKTEECYHCKKKLRVTRKSVWFLVLELLIVYALLNLLAIGVIRTVSFFTLFAMNAVPAVAAVLLFPFYIEFKKDE